MSGVPCPECDADAWEVVVIRSLSVVGGTGLVAFTVECRGCGWRP